MGICADKIAASVIFMNEFGSDVVSILALFISAFALALSILTAWLTLFRRGKVKMTRPTQLFFGYANPRNDHERAQPKVFLCTLLFATAKRGVVIENMYVKLNFEDIQQTFNIWVHGHNDKFVRGSGLFVGESGVQANHHFIASDDDEPFHFIAGTYQLEVRANILGKTESLLLFSCNLDVSVLESDSIGEHDCGLYFDWDPDEKRYIHHIKQAPSSFWQTQ